LRKRSTPAILTALLMLASAVLSMAGSLSPELEDLISNGDPDEYIRVIISPVTGDETGLTAEFLKARYRDRADRHRHGISYLKAVAERSQPAVLEQLGVMSREERARKVQPYWIANIIEAEVTVSGLRSLAESPEIETIEPYPEIISIPDIDEPLQSSSFIGVPDNLKIIKADSAWAEGYDGSGRIVCSFDTGVDGLHPALYNNYRGIKGYPARQCWFPAVDSSIFPHVFNSAGLQKSHGTHTTGIMVGHDDATGDTIGVALGADWIAAVAIDVPGSSIFSAFQWAVDPDRNPNTVTDVPDVINHSWGIPGIGCSDIFWEVIDNSEALGIVNIFAAGNGGSDSLTTRNPANRAYDSLTNFAVGALDSTFDTAWSGSSRGPSDCDSVSIKPNLAAPGTQIRSTMPDSGYVTRTGTSGAAPHVSGAVAILRQKNPDATVEEIKTALLSSTIDLGDPGPDNTFGWGRIDIMEALRNIDSAAVPSLVVARMAYPEINPGDAVSIDIALKNNGTAANNVTAAFANAETGMNIVSGPIAFGTIDAGAVAYGDINLDLAFDTAISINRFYSMDMLIEGDGYADTGRVSFFVGERGERTYFHHDTGRVKFTISNYGAFGFYGVNGSSVIGSFIPLDFEGYQLDRDTNDLYEGALLVGVDSLHVSDCAKNIAQEPDNDFAVMPGGSIHSFSPGIDADQETISYFDDRYAENPMGLSIRQKSYGWADDPDNSFIILEYIITNGSKASINGVRVGLYFDWDIRVNRQNRGSFLADRDIGYLCWNSNGDSADFRGVKVLNDEGLTNHRIYINPNEVYYSNFTEARKYQGLADNSSGTVVATTDVSHVTATGPFNLTQQQSDTAVFAVIGGADWDAFMISAQRAEIKYNSLPVDVDDESDIMPTSFAVGQNYPNPFNPVTTISFTVPKAGRVRIEIFDILGRRVRSLADGRVQAGRHQLEWDGTDEQGRKAASGIYFYRVVYDERSLTRKMILIK